MLRSTRSTRSATRSARLPHALRHLPRRASLHLPSPARIRGPVRAGLIAVILLALAAGAAPAAEDSRSPFLGEERITAIDLMVELPRPHMLRPFDHGPDPEDVRVELDGRTLPAFAVDPPPGDRGDAPWSLVLYFDLVLSDRSQVSWAADLLGRHLPELTRMGAVEVVVADPEPRTVVSPTRDTDRIAQVLDRMVFFPEAEDALVEARLALMDVSAESAHPEGSAPGPATTAADDPESEPSGRQPEGPSRLEQALVRDRLDHLTLALADRAPGADAPRRAVFLVTGGFDLAPGTGMRRATLETAETVAAYGWTVLPVLQPPPRGTVPGLRIGKWHLFKPSDAALIETPVLFAATRESERDPERGRAFVELARARKEQGELEGAARAARRAMTHFADDPRTAEPQARALRVLAEVYEAQGHTQLARRTYLRAATRAPESLSDLPAVAAALDRPDEALGLLAEGTLGAVIRGRKGWEPALRALDRRGLVSVQVAGAPDGRLHPVGSVHTTDGSEIPAVRAVRFGTPRSVVAARARKLLDDVPSAGDLPVSAALVETDGGGGGDEGDGAVSLVVRADPTPLLDPSGNPREAHLRMTLAVPGAEGWTEVVHLDPVTLSPAPDEPWGWEVRHDVRMPTDAGWGVVVVDELLTGAWGAAIAQPEQDR